MAMHVLPKHLHPEIRPRHIPHGNMVLDRDDPFGRATTWAFIPGLHDPRMYAGVSAAFPIGFQTLGQKMNVQMVGNASGDTYGISEYSGDGWGYSGLVGNLKDQSNSDGSKFFFGSGIEGQIEFPNKQSWSIWGLIKPFGNGVAAAGGDPRVLSRDQGSAANDHAYMIGGLDSSGYSRTRCDIGTGGTTTLVGSLAWASDKPVMIVATYDGSTLSIHTLLLEGGQYDVNTTVESGDINDNSGGTYGLVVGANYSADNGFEGEILGTGVLDYPLDEAGIREFASDITRIVKPAVPMFYFPPDTAAGGLTINPTKVASEEQVFDIEILPGGLIEPTKVASEEQVFDIEILPGGLIEPTKVATEEQVFDIEISLGSQVINPTKVASEEQVFDIEILPGLLIEPTMVASEEQVFNPTITGGLISNIIGFTKSIVSNIVSNIVSDNC